MTSFSDRIIEPLLSFLYPDHCASCNKPGSLLCDDCQTQLTYIASPTCQTCGSPTRSSVATCAYCHLYTLSHLNSVTSAVYYKGHIITSAIHHFKYKNEHALSRELAHLLAKCYQHNQNRPQTNVIVPVPLHKVRHKERGYNQSTLLAKSLSKFINQPVDTKTLVRNRATERQVSLNPADRKTNVADAFVTKSDQLAGQVVLLIDDVLTTGSTLNAGAKALKQGKVSAVHGLTVARAPEAYT